MGDTTYYFPVSTEDTLRLSLEDEAEFHAHDAEYIEHEFNSIIAEQSKSSELLRDADELIDRALIERQANLLIANRSEIEISYKTQKTYLNDARTLLFEALTASGHLSTIETTAPTLEEIHETMLSVLLNAYTDDLPEHEKARRFQEICEELTIQAIEIKIANGDIASSTAVATISDYLADGVMTNAQAMQIGYRPSNKKGMVRSSQLRINEDGTYTRISQQVSRSNSDANRTQQFLRDYNISLRLARHADISVLGTQLVHDFSEGVVGLMRRLDQHQGVNIRYGEASFEDQIAYEVLASESLERERVADCYIEKLAHFTSELDQKMLNRELSQEQYDAAFQTEVANILRAICVMDPSYAVGCFGEESQDGFVAASNLAAGGDHAGAAAVVAANRSNEQTVTFCGMSISGEEAAKMGAEIDPVTKLIQLGQEKWKLRKGVCRVRNCPSPRPSEVGPCAVCVGGCQKLFDKNWSYKRITAFYAELKRSKESKKLPSKGFLSIMGIKKTKYPKTTEREKIAA